MQNIFIDILPPWVETGLQPAFYDLESGTVLQQTARMYAKVRELTKAFNQFSEDVSNEINSFEQETNDEIERFEQATDDEIERFENATNDEIERFEGVINDTVEEYIQKFNDLHDYVEDYFDNLDVQEEINNKLDEMVEDGTLTEVIGSYLNYAVIRGGKLRDSAGSMQAGQYREEAQEVGFKWARMSFVWADCETELGVIDEDALDGYVQNFELYKDLGINTIALLCYNNTLYADSVYSGITTPENRAGFVNFCEAVADKLKGNGVVYTIWNEPNVMSFWDSENVPYYYTELVKEVSSAIKAIDPTAKIAGPEVGGIIYSDSTSNTTADFFADCCKNGLLNYIDYVSYHCYLGKNPEKILDKDNTTSLYLTKGIIYKYGNKDVPIIITECGGSTWSGGLSETEQANGLVRMLMVNHANGIKLSSIYTFVDTGTNPAESEQHYGIAYQNGVLKPSGEAIKFMLSLIGDYYFKRQEPTEYDGDYCYVYDDGSMNSHEIYVYWTTGTSHSITIDDSLVGCTYYTMTGTESTIASNTITVTNSPIYIVSDDNLQNTFVTKNELNDSINSAVQSTVITSKLNLDEFDFGTHNILKNSDLALGTKYITNWVGSSEVYTDPNLVDKCLKITSTGQGSYFKQAYNVKNGDVVTWTAWIKASADCNISIGCEAGETRTDANYLTRATGVVRLQAKEGVWYKAEKTFVVSHANQNNFFCYTQDGTVSAPIDMYLYHPQIVIGEHINTDFAPSLKDFLREPDLIETGTFTPKIVGANDTSIEVAGYTTQTGTYYKIAKMVFFNINIVVSDPTVSQNGYCVITGLPYQANSTFAISSRIASVNIGSGKDLYFYTSPSYKIITPKLNNVDGTGDNTMQFSALKAGSNINLSGFFTIN